MISVNYMGRFGNNLFQYGAACLLAKKFGISISNPLKTKIIVFDSGRNDDNFQETKEVNDDNFQEVYESEEISFNIVLNGFFQNRYVVDLFESNRDLFVEIPDISCYPYNFVHVRLGDLLDHQDIKRNMPNLDYYKRCLGNSQGGYISSDTPDHRIVRLLMREHGLIFYYQPPEETILWGARCLTKVLSLGTFSWWIGFLRSENREHVVFCPDVDKYKKWHGDIFPMKGWVSK